MLTTVRPDTNEEDTFFSRCNQMIRVINIVELSSQAGWAWQTKAAVSETGKEGGGKKLGAGSFRSVAWIFQLAKVEDPDIVVIMPSSSKGGILEKYIKVISSQVQISIVFIKNLESCRVALSSLTDSTHYWSVSFTCWHPFPNLYLWKSTSRTFLY